jgi:hypothetical protein
LYTTAPDSEYVGLPPGPAIVTDAVPGVPTHVTVTTTCTDVDKTLKVNVGEAVTVTVNVAWLLSDPLVPVTMTGKVPLVVVMLVVTVKVAVQKW